MQIYSVSIEPDQIEPILADSKIFFVVSYVKVKNFINSSFIDQFSNFFHLDRWKINFRNTQIISGAYLPYKHKEMCKIRISALCMKNHQTNMYPKSPHC